MKPRKNYTTHISTLMVAIQATEGLVIELGGGQSSTPFLHWILKAGRRMLYTYDDNQAYYEYAKSFQSPLHRIRKVDDWDDVPVEEAGVVFVDHHPSYRRSIDAIRFKDAADLVVIHDTERDDENYRNSDIWPHFKYRYDFTEARPWTTIVSNKIDVTTFGDRYIDICKHAVH